MDTYEKLAYAIGGFLLSTVVHLLKIFMPSYMDLYRENQELREKIRELDDQLEDEEMTRARERESGKEKR